MESVPDSVSGDNFSSDTTVPVYSGDRLPLCVCEDDRNLENDPQLRHLSHQWNQVFDRVFRVGSKTVKLTGHHDANVLSCVAHVILLLQSRAKLSAEERDYIEETIEIILAEFEELQVRIQFREDPEVAKKISDSLKATAASRRTRVGHITGIPATSSDLTSLVCRVQEKLAEDAIHSIHTKSTAKASKSDQEADFTAEHKKLAQEAHDYKSDTSRFKELCARNNIDTTTRTQKEARKREQCASKNNKSVKKSTVASTAQPAFEEAAVVQDLSKGDRLGDYAPLWSQGSNFLCRVRVHSQGSGK